MPENNKTEDFLKKLAPCIERGELEACVDEAARVAGEMGIGAEELLDLSTEEGAKGKYGFAYVIENATWHLEDEVKTEKQYKPEISADQNAWLHINNAVRLDNLNRKDEAEEQYKLAIAANPKHASAHINYANLLKERDRKDEAEEQYKL
ncbi:MAG: hypothetical protein KJ714_04385, partial [Euryarchaeota archaeon]|nr:hypothetical protein [Euryarchaeota archaeon]